MFRSSRCRRGAPVAAALVVAALVTACAVGEPLPPTDVTDTSATLHGNVYSSVEGDTAYWFVYGETTAYGNETPVATVAISDDQPHAVSEQITGLSADRTYHWRLCVQDGEEDPPRTICSKDQAFSNAPGLYVAMGDSVTQWGATDRYPERFFAFLEQAGAAEIGPPSYNLGQLGQTSGGLNSGQLPQTVGYIEDVGTDAAVITVNIGANDILNEPACDPRSLTSFDLQSCQPTLQTFEENFATTLASLNEALSDDPGAEQVIAMAYYNPWSGRATEVAKADQAELVLLGSDRTLDCDATGTDRGLNDRIACSAEEAGARLADAYPPFLDNGDEYLSDDIHPNEAGHQVIADAFEEAYTGAP